MVKAMIFSIITEYFSRFPVKILLIRKPEKTSSEENTSPNECHALAFKAMLPESANSPYLSPTKAKLAPMVIKMANSRRSSVFKRLFMVSPW
jgi:hypothetical protein